MQQQDEGHSSDDEGIDYTQKIRGMSKEQQQQELQEIREALLEMVEKHKDYINNYNEPDSGSDAEDEDSGSDTEDEEEKPPAYGPPTEQQQLNFDRFEVRILDAANIYRQQPQRSKEAWMEAMRLAYTNSITSRQHK